MQPYRFSPIQNKETLLQVVEYVATKNIELCERVVGKALPIISLSIFSHSQEEYMFLCDLLNTMGESVGENNGPRVKLFEPIQVAGNTIAYLRIRTPDDEHPQVGCNDFEVEDYAVFKLAYLDAYPQNLRLIVRADYELIEFFDPEYDVLAYVLSDPSRSTKGL